MLSSTLLEKIGKSKHAKGRKIFSCSVESNETEWFWWRRVLGLAALGDQWGEKGCRSWGGAGEAVGQSSAPEVLGLGGCCCVSVVGLHGAGKEEGCW